MIKKLIRNRIEKDIH